METLVRPVTAEQRNSAPGLRHYPSYSTAEEPSYWPRTLSLRIHSPLAAWKLGSVPEDLLNDHDDVRSYTHAHEDN